MATNAGGMRAVRYGVTRHHVLGLEVGAGRRHRPADGRQVRQVLERLRPHATAHRLRRDAGHHDGGDRQAPAPLHRDVHGPGAVRHALGGGPRGAAHCAAAASTRPSSSTSTSWSWAASPRRPGSTWASPRRSRLAPWPTSSWSSRAWTPTGWTRTSSSWRHCWRSSERSMSTCCRRRRGRSSSPPGSGRSSSARRPGATTSSTPSSRGRTSPTTWPGWPRWRSEHGAFITGCGHIGDGNVHITVFQPDDERRHALMHASFELALAVGGAISGEHGIGTAKLPYFLETGGSRVVGTHALHQAGLRPRRDPRPGPAARRGARRREQRS